MTRLLKRILGVYLSPYWKQGLLLLVCFATLIAFDTLFPLGIKFLIDEAITPRNGRLLGFIIGGLAALYLLSSFGGVSADYLVASVTSRLMNGLRQKMFDHLLNLPAGFYSRMQSGDVLTRFSSDLDALELALVNSVLPGVQYVLQFITSLVVLFLLSVPLSVLTVLLLPLGFILPQVLVKRGTKLVLERRVEQAGLSSAVQESLHAQAVTRIFGLQAVLSHGFARRLKRLTSTSTRSDFTSWSANRATEIGQYLIQLLVIAIGAFQVFNNRLSVGSLVGFVGLLNNLAEAVAHVSSAYAGLIPAAASLERVEGFLSEPLQASQTPAVALPRLDRQLAFEQVSFSYAGSQGKPDLERIDFSIPCGNAAAFIGRSGSGKSSILNLLMRFYDPTGGRILIDGRDIQQVSPVSLRSQMAVVFQDTFLFNLSLRENIRMGRPEASDAEVEAAAQAAEVHETILHLPGGYDSLAGEQGRLLSGGQRQRIALARAILRRPALLLLDESTSGLDPETETLIYATLKKLRGTCTILSFTHRLAPVVDMDQIVVLDQGRVHEQGTHAGLMSRQGLYYSMYTLQSGFTISADGLYADVTPRRLGNIPLFGKLDQPSLELLASNFVTERYEAGQTVIEQGQLADKFYIIVRGEVTVTVLGPGGQPALLRNWQDGDYFGELALLEGGRRSATVRTILPTLLLSLERKHFLNMLASHPDVRAAIEQEARSRRSGLDAVQSAGGEARS